MQHQVKKTEAGYQCEICEWQWKSKPSSGTCPGVRRYAWGSAPETLRTAYQLKKRKLKPGGEACGIVMGQYGDYWLYDIAQATSFTAAELAAEKERRRKARYATCRWCKREVQKPTLDEEYGACPNCLPHARETVQRRQEAEHQAMLQRDKAEQARWASDLLARDDCGAGYRNHWAG